MGCSAKALSMSCSQHVSPDQLCTGSVDKAQLFSLDEAHPTQTCGEDSGELKS